MKKLLIVTNTMGRAGAEKALIGLLRRLEERQCDVHLLSIIGRGALITSIPDRVRVLNTKVSAAPVLGWRGALAISGIVAVRLLRGGVRFIPSIAKRALRQIKSGRLQPDKLLWPMLAGTMPAPQDEYDLAIAFLEGAATYYVADKVKAKRKIAFVHVNYEKAGYDRDHDEGYYRKLDYICCVSDGVLRGFEGVFPGLSGKTRLFPNIIDPDAIRAEAALPGGFDDGFDGLRLLTVARLHPQKGLDMAIEAMAKLVAAGNENLRWYVIGEGMERPRLQRLIRQRGLKGRFILMGARDNPYPYMRQCDVYVQPSGFEGYGLTLLEALILHKPCVTTAFDGVPDLLTDDRDALIIRYGADQAADAIGRLVDDAPLRRAIGEGTHNTPLRFEDKTQAIFDLLDGMEWGEV